MRKILDYLKKGNGALILAVVCATAGSALFLPATGFVTTLPFIVMFTALPAFVMDKPYILPPIFFAVSYFFCFAKDIPLRFPDIFTGYTLLVALVATVASLLTCVACTLIKKSNKRKALYISLAAVILVGCVCGNAAFNGTPWDINAAKNEIYAYINSHFTPEELTIGKVYYVPGGNYYACDALITGTEDKASFIYNNGKVTDSFGELVVTYAGAGNAIAIGQVLRKEFVGESFTVTPTSDGFGDSKVSFKNPGSVIQHIDYTVTIHSEETAKSFVSKAEAFVAVIANSKLGCERITVVGGAKQKLYYSISVDVGAPHGSLANHLRVYSNTPLPQSSVLAAHSTFSK